MARRKDDKKKPRIVKQIQKILELSKEHPKSTSPQILEDVFKELRCEEKLEKIMKPRGKK